MPKLNIAFDGKSSTELKKFISENREIFASGNLHIKINDLLAELGIDGLRILASDIKSEL